MSECLLVERKKERKLVVTGGPLTQSRKVCLSVSQVAEKEEKKEKEWMNKKKSKSKQNNGMEKEKTKKNGSRDSSCKEHTQVK